MKRYIIIFAVLVLAVFSVLANGTSEEKSVITYGGSSTVAPIANAAIPGFEESMPEVNVTYETTGSSVGIKNLIAGTFALAGSSRELKESEVNAGCVKTPVALDGITVAVNGDVSISNLSMKQLAEIFTKEISNWSEVGGTDMPIELIVRDETSGTYGSFTEIVIQGQLGKEVSQSKQAIVARENGEVAAKIASTPGAIGYIGMGFTSIVTDRGGKELSIDGVMPNIENIMDKSYPISRSLYIITMGQPEEGSTEKAFIDYLLSPEGQAIVAEKQFIPLS